MYTFTHVVLFVYKGKYPPLQLMPRALYLAPDIGL
jgi:hypothetical protein